MATPNTTVMNTHSFKALRKPGQNPAQGNRPSESAEINPTNSSVPAAQPTPLSTTNDGISTEYWTKALRCTTSGWTLAKLASARNVIAVAYTREMKNTLTRN